jgi:hypothetical protein
VHYSELKPGDVVNEGGTLFRVVAEPFSFKADGVTVGWNVGCVAADDNVSTYFHPFVKAAGDQWALQYREDLAYAERVTD